MHGKNKPPHARRQGFWKFITPLEGGDGCPGEQIVEAERGEFVCGIQSIEIEVDEGETPIGIFVHQRESRAGNLICPASKAFGESFDKSRFSRAKRTFQTQNLATAQQTSELASCFVRLGHGPANPLRRRNLIFEVCECHVAVNLVRRILT